ncbi:hypothetical protein ACSU64_22815 [Bacillaceae bacterium C204]|uniref:hypothetical protein n=1 Tax=Neobacillus sp. 204 TaxID=3383351 RepID=UPI00397E82AC
MNIYLLLIISLVLLLFAGNAFYVTFKKYEDDDDFSGGWNTLSFIEFFLGVLLLISEKIFPKRYHIVIFKIISFLFGVFLVGLTVLFWVFLTPIIYP